MLLNQLVKINETGLVANAVSFELMDDPDKNLQLCQGFVFNYDSDPKKLKSSTVGVLDALRRSFHSQNEPNVHLMVQDYGKGKSHFALAVANFFKKPFDSPEVQGILQQVEYATSSPNPILEGLTLYKQRSRHLVICLSGDKPIDLKKHFLQVLKKALESEGITDSIAQQICKQPLQYLESLETKQREATEAFLQRQGNPEGDLNMLMQLLRDDNYQVIPRVKAICRELTGVTPDFEADIWDKISDMTALGDRTEKTVKIAEIWRVLSQPPYGYNEYTFTILFAGWLAYNSSELLLKGSFGIPQKKLDQVAIRSEPIKNWASTNVFDKPKDFVQVWIEKQQPSVIRRKLSPCPEVPDSVNYEQARQFIQEINSFLYGAPNPEKIDEITKIQQQLTSSIEQIDALLDPTSRAENLTEQDEIETLVQLYTEVQQPLSSITEDNLSVSPTEQQQNRRIQALQAITEKIGQTVEAEREHSQSLYTEADCGDYKADIQHLIAQLSQVTDLPPRFTATLEEALRAADNRLAEIAEQRKVENCLSQIQKLYDTLSDLATQQEYIRTQAKIEQLVESVPAARETDIYRNSIQALEEKQDALIRQVADWENQYSPSLSQTQAVQLSQRINQQINRYTDETNQQRLQELLNNLNDIILERRSEEQEEEQLQSILASAKGKLQDIKILKNLSDAFQSYQALSQLVLLPTAKTTSLEETQKQLESLKSEGHTIISQKILQIVDDCQHQVNQPQDYERLKRSLQRSQELVASYDEFAAVINRLEEAEQNLEAQYKDLQKRLQDENTMQAIRQNTLAKANTIHLCEEAIAEITSLSNQLHYHEQFHSELDKLIQGFKDKVVTYQRNLQNLCTRLSTVETSKELSGLRDEYAKLELVFKDSTDYPNYQQLQEQIQWLESDLEKIHNLETVCQQNQSIAGCDRTLAEITNKQANLRNLDRFKSKLLQLENELRQRKQSYIQQLNELQNKLSSVKTLKEAQKLQKELTDQSTYYRESQEEEQYQAISSEISLLISLLKIAATQKVDSVQACQAELERLSQWREREATEGITPTIQALLDSLIQEVEKSKQQIQKRHKRAAISWLQSIEKQDAQLEQLTDSATKLDTANQLLSKLKKQRQQHEDVLETEQKQIIERIFTRCEAIQNQDTESKILALFQDLPHPQQESLLKKLTEYVSQGRSCDSV